MGQGTPHRGTHPWELTNCTTMWREPPAAIYLPGADRGPNER